MIPVRGKQSGFSLIEIAIMLMIAGLLLTAAMEVYRQQVNEKIKSINENRYQKIPERLAEFLAVNQRLPCPADPSLDPNSQYVGREVCLTVAGQTALNYCGSLPSGAGQVCRKAGARDTDGNGANENILIGTVPFAALGIQQTDVLDGWGNQLLYAVSETLTKKDSAAPFVYGYVPDHRGVISLKSWNIATQSIVNTQNPQDGNSLGSFEIMLLSFGRDGKGAYDYQGKQIRACAGAAMDVENCNNDGTFFDASKLNDTYSLAMNPATGQQSTRYFDDPFTIFYLSRSSDKWTYKTGVTSIRAVTDQEVGIGITNPQFKMDVDGDIRSVTQGPGLPADMLANQFCSSPVAADPAAVPPVVAAPRYCFDTTMIAGVGTHCGDPSTVPGVMQGVVSNKADCVQKVGVGSVTPTSCPAGQFISGIDASGVIQCVTP